MIHGQSFRQPTLHPLLGSTAHVRHYKHYACCDAQLHLLLGTHVCCEAEGCLLHGLRRHVADSAVDAALRLVHTHREHLGGEQGGLPSQCLDADLRLVTLEGSRIGGEREAG